MRILKGILKESQEYYEHTAQEIRQKLANLPKGSIKERKINKKIYYYLQFRKGKKVIHKYLGNKKPIVMAKRLNERRQLEDELKKVRSSLKMLKRVRGRKRRRKT